MKAFLEDTCCTPELVECRDYETTVKIRFVAGKHHLLRADQEQELKMAPELAARFLERVDACLPDADLVLLSDYGKGLFDGETAPAVIAGAVRPESPSSWIPRERIIPVTAGLLW